MNAYNLAHNLYKARQADHTTIADPGDAGTIKVSPTDLNVCILTGGTTRELQAASEVPVGVEVLLISQTSTITVNSVALGDGEFAIVRVTLDSSGAHQWSNITSTDAIANAVTADAVLAAGVIPVGDAARGIEDATPVALGATNINTGDAGTDTALIALADALAGFGLITHTWT